jgi:hypothetical protein
MRELEAERISELREERKSRRQGRGHRPAPSGLELSKGKVRNLPARAREKL